MHKRILKVAVIIYYLYMIICYLGTWLEKPEWIAMVREWERTERGSLPSYVESCIMVWQVVYTKLFCSCTKSQVVTLFCAGGGGVWKEMGKKTTKKREGMYLCTCRSTTIFSRIGSLNHSDAAHLKVIFINNWQRSTTGSSMLECKH